MMFTSSPCTLMNPGMSVKHGYWDAPCNVDSPAALHADTKKLSDWKNWVVDRRRERLSDMKPAQLHNADASCLDVRPGTMANGKEDDALWDRYPLTRSKAITERQTGVSKPASTSSSFRLYERMLNSCDATLARKAFSKQSAQHTSWRDKLKAQIENAEKKRVQHSLELRRFLPSVADGVVLPKLTAPMLEEIESALRPTPAHEALAKGFGLTINRSDMSTLAEFQWLNDEVVNFYMNLLVERTKQNSELPKLYAFNTFFFTKMAAEGHGAVRRWTRKVDLFTYDIVLVPLHFTMHWCLATIDFRKKRIAYYDSMGSSRERHNCLQKLQLYLEEESQDKRGHGLDWEPWKLQVMSDLPQQHNGSDCGMFTCQYAECVSRDAKISFGQQHMPYFRKRVVYEILHGQLLPV
ncbi:unnamed protein product [Ixodes hexagonus]